jgi:hypothetical protein
MLVCVRFQSHAPKKLHRTRFGVFARHLARTPRGQCDVVEHRQMSKQIELLEHHSHLFAQGIQAFVVIADFDAVHRDPPLIVVLEPVERAQQRALSRAGRADNDRDLPSGKLGTHVTKHMVSTKALVNVFDCDQGFTHFRRPSTSRRLSTAFEICVSAVVRSR